jgi:hypothetical protein
MSEVGPDLKPAVAEVAPDQNAAAQNPAKTVRRIFQLKPPKLLSHK